MLVILGKEVGKLGSERIITRMLKYYILLFLSSVSFSVFSLIVMIMFQFKYEVYFHCGKTLGILISHLLSNIYSGSKVIIRYLIIFSYESQGMGSLKAFHLQHLEKKIM